MATWILPLLSGRHVYGRDSRAAPHIDGARLSQPLSIGSLFLTMGTVTLPCEALRIGAHYDVAASGFQWRSKDGLCIAINDQAFTGGRLTPSGAGNGTLIQRIINNDPFPNTIYAQDEEL